MKIWGLIKIEKRFRICYNFMLILTPIAIINEYKLMTLFLVRATGTTDTEPIGAHVTESPTRLDPQGLERSKKGCGSSSKARDDNVRFPTMQL